MMSQIPFRINHALLDVGRAVSECMRGMGIFVECEQEVRAVLPVENAGEDLLAFLNETCGAPHLLIPGPRARALGLGGDGISLLAPTLTMRLLHDIADPQAVGQKSVINIQATEKKKLSESQEALLAVCKEAGLLPSVLVWGRDCGQARAALPWLCFPIEHLLEHGRASVTAMAASPPALLPIEGAEHVRIMAFRALYGTSVHLALIIGDVQATDTPLVRVHSSCVTGDILGSLRCDCGGQLRQAIEAMIQTGSGVLLYLHQEGRGIGIANKLRAYRLQEEGVDTFEANQMLGLEADERDFSIAAAILNHLELKTIRLLTNNPAKIMALESSGVLVKERVPLAVKPGEHNARYLAIKGTKGGHVF